MPEVLPLPEGGFCSYSPDGKKLAYNRVMREFRTWKYYKGGMADDIWVYDPAAKKVENITNNVSPIHIGIMSCDTLLVMFSTFLASYTVTVSTIALPENFGQ